MRPRDESGQAIVEFALILPILILLLCGLIDSGWLLYNRLMTENAAREATRYSALHIYDDGVYNSADDERARLVALGSSGILPDTLSVDVRISGGAVTVRVTTPTVILTGLTSSIYGGSVVDVESAATMFLES